MFMRLRSHTCHYCHTIDEAHHKRHRKIAEAIRDVYESYDEFDWNIIPSELEERGRAREYSLVSTDDGDADRPCSEDAPSSKRERKDAKNLSRAASRARIISQDEIVYVDSILHLSDGVSGDDSDGPCSNEELEEINRHLMFNAHVFNSQCDNRAIKKYARLPDVDVDFDAEIERILDVFRINELLQRNTRNRGLQGKELKTFLTLVKDLKKMLVDDLVSVKRDVLEIRMRRAGYLRYTNKTAHNLVEERYTDKDWKTGERYYSNTSDSSSAAESPIDEVDPLCSSPPPLPRASIKHGPDLRHLQKTHLRVNGDDGLGQRVIEPYHTPLLPMTPDTTTRKRAVQLKVVNDKPPVLTIIPNGSRQKSARPVDNGTWQTVMSSHKAAAPSVKPAWGMDASGRPAKAPRPAVNPWGENECEIPDLRSFKSDAVQSADVTAVTPTRGPDGFVDAAKTVPTKEKESVGHPAVNQKKAKKHEREARRKAKKIVVVEEEVSIAAIESTEKVEDAPKVERTIVKGSRAQLDVSLKTTAKQALTPDTVVVKTTVEVVAEQIPITSPSTPGVEVLEPSVPAPPRITRCDKQMNWTKFKRQFIVDQMTDPCLQSSSGCSHGTSCAYEANGMLDCPFHEPHCGCADPLMDECYLVYPCSQVASSGPYNRLRGQKLFSMYQNDEQFMGRIMLVDSDLLHYFMSDPNTRMFSREKDFVPKRIATEYADFAEGYNPGPLMEQEKQFESLWSKNNIIKRKLTTEALMKVQREKFEKKGAEYMCYCHDIVPDSGLPANVIECTHRDCTMKVFHKACVKKLGVEKVSRWICTMCEEQMRTTAYRLLRDLGYDDVPDVDAEIKASMEKLQERYGATDAQMKTLRDKMARVGGARGVRAMAMMMGGI